MKPLYPFVALIVCLLFCLHSCKKDKKTTAPVTYDFTYTGNLWIYDTISFQSTAPANSTFLWKFGDGTISTDANPGHVYKSVPFQQGNGFPSLSDTVILVVNNDSIHPVIKSLKITPGATRLSGTWHWTGGYYYATGDLGAGFTPYHLNDTAFTITAVNDSTIKVWGKTIVFTPVYNGYYFDGYMYSIDVTGPVISYNGDTIFFKYCTGDINAGAYVASYHSP